LLSFFSFFFSFLPLLRLLSVFFSFYIQSIFRHCFANCLFSLYQQTERSFQQSFARYCRYRDAGKSMCSICWPCVYRWIHTRVLTLNNSCYVLMQYLLAFTRCLLWEEGALTISPFSYSSFDYLVVLLFPFVLFSSRITLRLILFYYVFHCSVHLRSICLVRCGAVLCCTVMWERLSS
jgi:hypothetical protein